MTGVQNIINSHEHYNTFNSDDSFKNTCTSCNLYIEDTSSLDKNTLEQREAYCSNYCTKKVIQKKDSYCQNGYVIRKRLSRLQLAQLLLYHALDVGANGIIRDVSEEEVADILGCTVKSVRNNNKALKEFNYILYSRISKDRFSVILLDYNKYHLSSKDGGRGYIVMSSDTLVRLINVEKVNSLRIEIRSLVKFDDNNVRRIKTRETNMSYNDISLFLPNYMRHKAAIDRAIENTSGIFNMNFRKNEVSFHLKDEFDGKNERRKLSNEYKLYFRNYCENKHFNLTEKDYDDLTQMSLEYRFNIVAGALDLAYKEYYLKNIIVENYCGLIREIVKNKIDNKKVA